MELVSAHLRRNNLGEQREMVLILLGAITEHNHDNIFKTAFIFVLVGWQSPSGAEVDGGMTSVQITITIAAYLGELNDQPWKGSNLREKISGL